MDTAIKVLAVAFLVLTGFSGYLLVQSAANYVAVTEATGLIENNVHFQEVQIHWTGVSSDEPRVVVVFNVTNAARVAIVVITLEFNLYMDDHSDPTPLQQKLDSLLVGPAAMSIDRRGAPPLGPGEQRLYPVTVRVTPGTIAFSRFNHTDGGRFFPIVLPPKVVISFPDFETTHLFYLDEMFLDPRGVERIG